MADEQESGQDRTEAATQRHLDQAREGGNVPISRELPLFITSLTASLMLFYYLPGVLSNLTMTLAKVITDSYNPWMSVSLKSYNIGFQVTIIVILIPAAIGLVGAISVLLQSNFLLYLGALRPRVSRINPVSGLGRLFGRNGLNELGKSMAKLCLLSVAFWFALFGELHTLINLVGQNPDRILSTIMKPLVRVFVAAICVKAIIAALDLALVRFQHAQDLRMSRQDIRDEMKDTDGNPHIKSRIRRIRATRARKRMMAKVSSATVVVTNPTHYAVALAYDRSTNLAPKIVAKGIDFMAAKIRDVATANNIPIIANPPLARALYRLELDSEIPAEHYKAAAEVIAFVWRLGKARPVLS